MGAWELFIMAVALSMDAFAVSICKGIATTGNYLKTGLVCGLWFGFFQALMPVIGYILGSNFEHLIVSIDHWIIFALLSFIGVKMIKESFSNTCENVNDNIDFKTMLILALATSIDALAVGITFAFLDVNIVVAICLIGIITWIFSICGVKIGNRFGDKYESKAEFAGGGILILIGIKILLEHLQIL